MKLSVATILYLASRSNVLANTDPRRTLDKQQLLPADRIDSRIIGGDVVTPKNKYPYIVFANRCGASLVAPNVLLSAAHCQTSFSEVQIRRQNRAYFNKDYNTFNVIDKKGHPDYDSNSLD